MRITFLLFAKVHRPIGGVKVVYEYANRLSKRGHQVTVVHAAVANRFQAWYRQAWTLARFLVRRFIGQYGPEDWFGVDSAVRMRWCLVPRADAIPPGDIVVATAWPTAYWAQTARASAGAKVYLLQHLETWGKDAVWADGSWKLPLHKVAIARWLVEYGSGIGEHVDYVPNGLDFSSWGVDVPIGARDPASVTLLCHRLPYKGTRDALSALAAVRAERRLTVNMFGVMAKPEWVPDWVKFHQNPPQAQLRALYNAGAIFIAPSHEEGWGLPACEAMACGCALLATDVGGHREFTRDRDTAHLFPARDTAALTSLINHYIDRPDERIAMAERGNRAIRAFEWERSVETLEALFHQWAGNGHAPG